MLPEKMISETTTSSPNFPKVLASWVGEKESKNILSQDRLILPYWFDQGILECIANEVALLDHNDRELEQWAEDNAGRIASSHPSWNDPDWVPTWQKRISETK